MAILHARVDAETERRVNVDVKVELKARGHDTDDGPRVAVEGKVRADDRRVRGKAAVPEGIADYDDGSRIGLIFVGAKCTAASDPVNLRLPSSGHGESRFPVLSPASTCPTGMR